MSRCLPIKKKFVKLSSSTKNKPILLPVNTEDDYDSDSDNELEGIIKTIRFVGEDNPALPVDDIIPKEKIYSKNIEEIVNMCNKYNRCINTIKFLEEGTSLSKSYIKTYPSRELCNFIIQQSYKRAVKNPAKLNKYDPFSPEVYGETSFELVCLIIDNLKITENDVFLDLGSGVGQVVLQMAALTPCKMSIGIEKNIIPSLYGENLASYFREWMAFFGKKYNQVNLVQNDFLNDECLEYIRNATIIFVNNVSFGPKINHELSLRFQDLNEGVRIISPVTFCPEKFRITGRSLNNIASIMSIVEIPHLKGPVSWTSKSVAYYVHIVDRRKLENFFEENAKKERGSDSGYRKIWKKTYNSNPTSFQTVFVSDNSETTSSQASSASSFDVDISNSSSSIKVDDSDVEIQSKQFTEKLNELLSNFANQYQEMLKIMKQDSYRQFILQEIEKEKKRNVELKETVQQLERRNKRLDEEGLFLLQSNWSNIVKSSNCEVNF